MCDDGGSHSAEVQSFFGAGKISVDFLKSSLFVRLLCRWVGTFEEVDIRLSSSPQWCSPCRFEKVVNRSPDLRGSNKSIQRSPND